MSPKSLDGDDPDSSPTQNRGNNDVKDVPSGGSRRRAARTDGPRRNYGDIGGEIDPALRTFGILCEGFRVGSNTSNKTCAIIRERFMRRYELATLSEFPEGYEFRIRIDEQEEEQFVILLTPPDMIAVRAANGNWLRRLREESDGPAPYDYQWYRDYLTANSLPGYFMRPEHLACLFSEAESHWIGVKTTYHGDKLPRRNYFELRYPEVPQSPAPNENGATYAYDLSKEEQLRLARRFPATTVNARNFGSYRIFVSEDGYISVRRQRESATLRVDEQLVPQGEVTWQPDDGTATPRASYVVEGGDDTSGTLANTPLSQEARNELVQEFVASGGIVNPNEVPQGVGEWQWLEPGVDEAVAQGLGFNTPVEVTLARRRGRLNVGTGPNAGPMVVYTPHTAYFNPPERPAEAGHWEYLTTQGDQSARALAWMNFGLQAAFPNNARPTAEEIWNLRRQYRTRIRQGVDIDDYTADIDLVYVPFEAPRRQHAASLQDGDVEIDRDVVDPDTGVRHDPLNRGENNQTGNPETRFYQSREIGGYTYTVDRSRAHVSGFEKHKAWVCTKKGTWQKWGRYDGLDWESKKQVEDMNKWREQTFSRNGWPPKRKAARDDYTQEQKNWLFSFVRAAQGRRPAEGIPHVTGLFNHRFDKQPHRNDAGITAVLDRLREEYRKYGGERKPHRPRGHNKKEEADRRKSGLPARADGEEEEEHRRKKAKSSATQAEGEEAKEEEDEEEEEEDSEDAEEVEDVEDAEDAEGAEGAEDAEEADVEEDEVVKEKDDVVKEKDEVVKEKEDVVQEKDEVVQEKDEVVKEKDEADPQPSKDGSNKDGSNKDGSNKDGSNKDGSNKGENEE